MKISTRKDIDAPVDVVYATLSDFARMEARAQARGIEIERVDADGTADVGPSWTTKVNVRGRERVCHIRLVTIEPAGQLAFKFSLEGLSGLANLELVELAPARTRLFVAIEAKPGTMTARILLQSLKVAKGSLTRRLDSRLDNLAHMIEAAYPTTP